MSQPYAETAADRLALPVGQWESSDGRRLAVGSMAISHLVNTVAKLRREGAGDTAKCRELAAEIERRDKGGALEVTATPARAVAGADEPMRGDATTYVALLFSVALTGEALRAALTSAGTVDLESKITDMDEVAETLRDRVLRLMAPGKARTIVVDVLAEELDGVSLAESLETWADKYHDGSDAHYRGTMAAFRDRLAEKVLEAFEVAGLLVAGATGSIE